MTPPLNPPSTANAVDRETAWLSVTNDNLPALLRTAGGPFDVVNAYWPRTPDRNQCALYVRRTHVRDARIANQRKRATYMFALCVWWPVGATSGAGSGEAEQRALDVAVEQIIERVRGQLGDHTHGGYFLSAAEIGDISVTYHDPEQTMPQRVLRADISYTVDDFETVI